MNYKNIRSGVVGGLLGGALFGVMMAQMGTLPMIGKMVGAPSAVIGFLVHLLISVLIGATFAVLFHRVIRNRPAGLGYGLAYGGLWWLLGPLTLMPLFMGMGLGVNWTAVAAAKMFPSLIGHLVFGGILGLTYSWLRGCTTSCNPARVTDQRPVELG